MRAPEFWSGRGMLSTLLLPAGWIYAQATARRVSRQPRFRPPVPVVCVGNLTAGGSGKTPTVLALATLLRAMGRSPAIVTRGYRGRLAGPVRVDPASHGHRDVGDEPLLLARAAPTWVARDRAAGAEAAIADGAADVLLLDDGFQNPDVAKDLSLLVIDGGYGFANRRPIPSGPLRETIRSGIARADAAILIGADRTGARKRIGDLPLLRARFEPVDGALDLAGHRVLAFCGIGRPEKFFETLRELGATFCDGIAFPDHHVFSGEDVMLACEIAAKHDAIPVTTEKDYVRLPREAQLMVTPVPVRLSFAEPDRIEALLREALLREAIAGRPVTSAASDPATAPDRGGSRTS